MLILQWGLNHHNLIKILISKGCTDGPRLRALAVLTADLAAVFSTHMKTHNHLYTP